MSKDDFYGSVSVRDRSLVEKFKEVLVTGLAVLIPAVASVYVLYFLASFIFDLLLPLINVVEQVPGASQYPRAALGALTVFVLFVIALMIGLIALSEPGDKAITFFEVTIQRVPGIGVMYESFQKLSNVFLEDRKHQFQEVKLVEFPHEDTYTLGFETTRTPDPIHDASETEEDMVTLFLPLAPNPFIGGFLAHVPESRVKDVDMSVEEGVATVLTVGVGTSTHEEIEEAGVGEVSLEKIS